MYSVLNKTSRDANDSYFINKDEYDGKRYNTIGSTTDIKINSKNLEAQRKGRMTSPVNDHRKNMAMLTGKHFNQFNTYTNSTFAKNNKILESQNQTILSKTSMANKRKVFTKKEILYEANEITKPFIIKKGQQDVLHIKLKNTSGFTWPDNQSLVAKADFSEISNDVEITRNFVNDGEVKNFPFEIGPFQEIGSKSIKVEFKMNDEVKRIKYFSKSQTIPIEINEDQVLSSKSNHKFTKSLPLLSPDKNKGDSTRNKTSVIKEMPSIFEKSNERTARSTN